MDKTTALKLLDSARAHDRLLGARFLQKTASREDAACLGRAFQKENVSWVRNALRAALALASGDTAEQTSVEVAADSNSSALANQIEEIYSNALQETASQLLHEIEPLLGIARLYAEREIRDFAQSKTKSQLDLLDILLTAISDLRKASTPAPSTEIELSAVLRELRDLETRGHDVDIQLAGPAPFNAITDRGRLWLAVMNGLRNAVEATEAFDKQDRRPIVINWNRTDQEYWISIIDYGIGIRASLEKIFEIGTSSKRDHVGMGLPTARQAILSMGGQITVTPREEVGVKFEIRWPRYVTSPL